MARTVLIFLVGLVAVWVLWNALVTTDLDRVEDDINRLVALALEGGEDATNQILDAFADDYRGSDQFALDKLERRIRRWVEPGKVKSLKTGDFNVVSTGEEIEVPLLAVYATLDNWDVRMIIRVTYGKRDDEWKIVNVQKISWGS